MLSSNPTRTLDAPFMPDRRVLTPADVAEMLGVSPRTLARWHLRRLGPPRCKIGRRVFYRLEAIEAWLAANETSAPTSRVSI